MIRTNSVLHLLLLLGVAISGIGCKEHKRLEAETASIKAKFLEIRLRFRRIWMKLPNATLSALPS